MLPNRIANYLDMLAVWTLSAIVTAALVLQVTLHELPCPLCLLQRAGLLLIALTLTFNLTFGRSTRHYGFVIIAALVTAIFAIRQILLHILPHSSTYGFPVWGLSLYAWISIIAAVMIVYSALMLIITKATAELTPPTLPKVLSRTTICIVLLLALANTVSTLLECGPRNCPANPVHYQLLSR